MHMLYYILVSCTDSIQIIKLNVLFSAYMSIYSISQTFEYTRFIFDKILFQTSIA